MVFAVAVVTAAAAGCGSGAGPATPTMQRARVFELAGFQPSGPVEPGKPVRISFAIRQPSGAILTRYRRGSGPHTGIHLILVRSDLDALIHRHPPVAASGRVSESVTFPAAGRYRLVVDAYPNLSGPLRNFQLFRSIQVGTGSPAKPLPPFRGEQTVDGFRVSLPGPPNLRAIQPALLSVSVTGPDGTPARFTPWYGALAHAIFFHAGNLDYFHTHVCAPAALGCTSTVGGASVTGQSSKPGKLRVGVLLPEPGRWRLFLQFRADGRVVTAPFTLRVGGP
jgi:hypothetical protein